MQYRGYKYRLYPDAEARAFFARCFGATRYCYNFCVREYDASCRAGRELSGYDVAARLREHTKNLAWMADVDYEIKESAPRRFDNALGKYKRREANRPREHKKGERPEISYTTGGVIKVDFKHGLVQLPKIGIVRARLHRPFSGQIVSATIKHEADGNYYISLCVSSDSEPRCKPHTEAGTVGVDVGLRHLATLSIDGDGKYIDLPDMSRGEARIQFLKKRLSLAKEGSRRAKRTKLQIARLQHHLSNVTRDAHHKAAARLCRDYDTICMETLNVAGMKQDASTTAGIAFNQRLQRSALSLFIGRVERKAADTGTNFVKIDRFEPSTKRCHVCGYVLDDIDLHTKEWTCPDCGTHHDRDHNAAINIRNKGLEQFLTARQMRPSRLETDTTDKLPLAEGNVKPAKKATAGCDLRTGKGATDTGRSPKAQIADGTAPPRLFDIQRLEKDHPFHYFKMSTLGRMAGFSRHKAITTFIDECRFMDPTPEDRVTTVKLMRAIKTVAANLRQMRLTDGNPAYTKFMLGKMNKVARVDWVLREHFHFECTFSDWRSHRLSQSEIDEINQVATVDFPNKLDALADKYLHPNY